jgi:hypothetical protein
MSGRYGHYIQIQKQKLSLAMSAPRQKQTNKKHENSKFVMKMIQKPFAVSFRRALELFFVQTGRKLILGW